MRRAVSTIATLSPSDGSPDIYLFWFGGLGSGAWSLDGVWGLGSVVEGVWNRGSGVEGGGGGVWSVGGGVYPPTRWSTTLSSKVNLPHAINLRALCGANLVTLQPKIEGTKPSYSTVWHARGLTTSAFHVFKGESPESLRHLRQILR